MSSDSERNGYTSYIDSSWETGQVSSIQLGIVGMFQTIKVETQSQGQLDSYIGVILESIQWPSSQINLCRPSMLLELLSILGPLL